MDGGSIRVPTKLDLTGIKKDIRELEKLLGQAGDEIQDLEDKKLSATKESDKMYEKTGDEKYLEESIRAQEKLTQQQAEVEKRAAGYREQLEQAREELERMNQLTGANSMLNASISQDDFAHSISSQAEYDNILEEIQRKMDFIEQQAARIAKETGASKTELLGVNQEYQKLADQMKTLQRYKFDFKGEANAAKGFGNGLKSITRHMLRFGVAMLGVRSTFMLFRRAVSAYMETNQELTNTLNGVWAALGEMVGPAIEWLINLLAKAIGYVNAFVAALSGINFIARANEKALKKQAAAAGAAAKAQNASFDEQNKLSETGGGGGGGGSAAGAFDPDLDAGIIDKLQKMAGFLKENLDLVLAIGAAFLTWKIAEALGGDLSTVLGLALAIGGSVYYVQAFWDAWQNGLSELDIEKMVLGMTAAVIGLGIALGPTAAAVALLVGGLGILVLGIKEFVETGELTDSAFKAIEFGLFSVGAALSVLTTSWIPMAIAAFAALVFACLTRGEEISNWLMTAKQTVIGALSYIRSYVANFFSNLIANVEANFGALGVPIAVFLEFVSGCVDGAFAFISGVISAIIDLVNAIVRTISAIATGDWAGAWEAWKQVFLDIWGVIEGGIKGVINGIIGAINAMIRGLNKIHFSVPSWVPALGGKSFGINIPQIPKLARGAIVNNPGRGVTATVGEAGREAVLPLDRNTEWIDELAERINGGSSGGNVTIPIYLDGRKIAQYVVDVQKKRAFALNGG